MDRARVLHNRPAARCRSLRSRPSPRDPLLVPRHAKEHHELPDDVILRCCNNCTISFHLLLEKSVRVSRRILAHLCQHLDRVVRHLVAVCVRIPARNAAHQLLHLRRPRSEARDRGDLGEEELHFQLSAAHQSRASGTNTKNVFSATDMSQNYS